MQIVMVRTEIGYGIEILHKRFRIINKEKHSIHITAWSDCEMKRSLFYKRFQSLAML